MNSAGASPMDFNRIVNGVIRTIKLDRAFFREIKDDPSYTRDAWTVVIVVSVIAALGTLLGSLFSGHFLAAIVLFLWTAIWGVVGFYVWVFLTHWLGTSFFKGEGTIDQTQRCLGFAWGPRILGVLAIIPCLGWIAALAGAVLSIIAGYFAVQESLNQDSTNALLTVIISAVIVFIVGAIVTGILGAIGLAGAAASGAFR